MICAALAAAQARGADGEALLRAMVVGYEVSTRIGVAVQPSHYKYWHTTGTIGTFGAAAAVATVLKLDAEQTAHALANAGTFAAALQQAFRSDAMSKPLHAGHAADAGAMAALGAAQGVTGALDVLEGAAGFGAAMSTGADWSRATDGLGTRYNITAMTSKNHGCCGHSFAAIDAALALQAEHAHPARADRARHRRRLPRHRRGHRAKVRRHAVRGPVLHALHRCHRPGARQRAPGRVRARAPAPIRQVQALMQRVDVVLDPRCEADFPGRRSGSGRNRDEGRTAAAAATSRTARAIPRTPLTDAELTEKFFELADARHRPRRRANACSPRLWALDRQPHVRFAADALSRAAE